jgi:hypothetical protein
MENYIRDHTGRVYLIFLPDLLITYSVPNDNILGWEYEGEIKP